MDVIIAVFPLLAGWILDRFFGDPERLPHPIVWFGKSIHYFEHRFNRGASRKAKGALVAIGLIGAVYLLAWGVLRVLAGLPLVEMLVETVAIFFCLAGTTLVREVMAVFAEADKSLEAGRKQVARIVGRDTGSLTDREVRTAALETLAENLSDGVIAPLFWYMLLGVPGMLAYKMVNTLDSMVGYRNARYREFGCWAAHIDDVANYIPARLTALLMVMVAGRPGLLGFVARYGSKHASPNSGYPEAALAGVLDCRFGGPHDYFGERVEKPYIGHTERGFSSADVVTSVKINRRSETVMVLLVLVVRIFVR